MKRFVGRLRWLVPLCLIGAGAALVLASLSEPAPSESVDEATPTAADEPPGRVPRVTDAGSEAPLDGGRREPPARWQDIAPSEPIRCVPPPIEVPRTAACARGRPYPRCRWNMPSPPDDTSPYRIWRNTTAGHRSGRPGLVSLILASAAEYQRRWPGEQVTVGDLDAPGPRHRTHRRGQDVDLYLEHAMIARNEGHGVYVDNYEGRSAEEVAGLRARVFDYARILALCAGGEVRIYYNDAVVEEAFLAWFDAEGLESSVGPAMTAHNRLHRFHFHLTVPLDLAPLPVPDTDADARAQ